MAGHSKWANIKHRKGRQDAKRGKIFTKLIRELTIAAKSGSAVSDNPRLRLAVDKALSVNMSRDTIDRAIARGAGNNEADNMQELSYEGYAQNGIAIFVDALTDNRNRTASEIRHIFSKCGGNLASDGSVAYMFKRVGHISFDKSSINFNDLMEIALDANATDIIEDDEEFIVETDFKDFHSVLDALSKVAKCKDAQSLMIPVITSAVNDNETVDKLLKIIDMLEDNDDVQNVYHNAEISEDIIN